MSKIQIARYSEQLRRMLGMKGVETVASELSPEISATINLETAGAEWDFLKGVRGGTAAGVEAASPANACTFRLRNPVDSGAIAVVSFVEMSGSGITQFRVTRNTEVTDLANVGVTTTPDFRWGQTGAITTTALIFSSKNNTPAAPVGDLMAIRQLVANSYFLYVNEVVLIPGTAMDFGASNANLQVFVNTAWKERRLPELEA